jgi:hypothetical protein
MNSTVRYHQRRLADTATGLRAARGQVGREQGPRAQLVAHQQQRLDTVVRHAASHSPFYCRWLAETGALGAGPVELQRLPVLDKSLLMEHFDELVCDPRLRRDQLLDWAGQLTRDRLYLDRYRVLVTSGSSGRPGLFVYDPVGWRSIITQMLRSSSWAGLAPSLPPPAGGLDQRHWALPHHPPGGGHSFDRRAPGPGPAGHPAAAGAGRGAQPVPAHLPECLQARDRRPHHPAGPQQRPLTPETLGAG